MIGTHDPDAIKAWTWSDVIEVGREYQWNVTKFTDRGVAVNSTGNSVRSIGQGDIISVTPLDDISNLDYFPFFENDLSELPFDVKINGILIANPDKLAIEFIFPNTVLWTNGTRSNLFHMNIPKYNHELWFSPDSYLTESEYIIEIDHPDLLKVITRDINTGLLNKWHIETMGAVLIYERIIEDFNQVSDNSKTILHVIVISSPFMLFSILIIVFKGNSMTQNRGSYLNRNRLNMK